MGTYFRIGTREPPIPHHPGLEGHFRLALLPEYHQYVPNGGLVNIARIAGVVANMGHLVVESPSCGGVILADVEMEFRDNVRHAVTPVQSFTHVSPTSHQIFMVMCWKCWK